MNNWRRIALAGSVEYPLKPPWRARVHKDLEEQLMFVPQGGTFYLRHGHAWKGADRIGHEWFAEQEKNPLRPDVTMIEEKVPADWRNCIPACPTKPGHRKINSKGDEYCSSAGQRRNPDVVVHPDHPVTALLAYSINNSSGTAEAVRCAKNNRVPHTYRNFYL